MVRGEYKEVQVWTDLGNKISIKSQVVTIKVTMLCYRLTERGVSYTTNLIVPHFNMYYSRYGDIYLMTTVMR